MSKFSAANAKSLKLTLVALVVLGLSITTFAHCTIKETEKAPPVHLKVGTLPYLGFATFYIAQDEGYFAEQGLEVEFVKFSTVTDSMPLLAQGSLDVSAGPVSASLFNAINQNMGIRIVAGREYIGSDIESMAIMARKDLYDSGELNTVARIKGRQVALPALASLNHFFLSKTLEKAGLSLKDVTITRMTPKDAVAAFEKRAIDAACIGTPQIDQLKSLGQAVALEYSNKLLPGFQQGFVMYGPTLLEKDLELGKKFMVAYLKGCRQYGQGLTDRNLEVIKKYLGLDKEMVLQAGWNPVYPDGRIKAEDILAFQDWAYQNGFVDKKLNREQIIDTRFVDYATGVLGPVK